MPIPSRPGAATRGLRAVTAVTVGALLSLTAAGTAQADDLYNTLGTTATGSVAITPDAEVMKLDQGGPTGSTKMRVQARNSSLDGFEGCNTPKGTKAIFDLASSDTGVATVDPATLELDGCFATATGLGPEKTVTVTPVRAGTATITATLRTSPTSGTYRVDTATFRVEVAPPPNTKPSVAVVGVEAGAEYRKGTDVPKPMCQSTDAEDGTTTFEPAMSRGEDADEPNGLGLRIATCRYTDTRGAAADVATVRYYIVDGTPPVVSYRLERKAPDNGWYRSEVALDWIVTDPESEQSLVPAGGCDRVWLNTDQAGTVFSCTATSKGGSTTVHTAPLSYDATPPTVTGVIDTPSVVVDGVTWYPRVPAITWTAEDSISGVVDGSIRPTVTVAGEGRNQMARTVATDVAGNTGGTSIHYLNVDASAPVVKAALTGTPAYDDGTTAWFKDAATVEVTAKDPDVQPYERGSGLLEDPTGPYVIDTTTDFTATATDRVGHVGTSNTVPVHVDSAAPVVKATCPSARVVKGVPASAKWSASDEASGLATAASGSARLDTSKIGRRTFTAPTATDRVGHVSGPATCEYTVVYAFVGFLSPIDNHGVYNKVKAGSAVPVKFSLVGNQGMDILSGAPVVTKVACPSTMKTDSLEETAKSSSPSGLKYDSKTTVYTYTWKTAATFAGTCQKLTVNLADGTSHTALFHFTK